jgi:hypothetical protein
VFYPSFSGHRRGLVGSLHCTNFRLCFISAAHDTTTDMAHANALYVRDAYDYPLAMIDAIEYSIGGAAAHGLSSRPGSGKYNPVTEPNKSQSAAPSVVSTSAPDKPRRYRPMTGPLSASEVNAISGMRVTTTDFRVCEYDFKLSEYSSVTVSADKTLGVKSTRVYSHTDAQPDLPFYIVARTQHGATVSL